MRGLSLEMFVAEARPETLPDLVELFEWAATGALTAANGTPDHPNMATVAFYEKVAAQLRVRMQAQITPYSDSSNAPPSST